MAGMPVLHVSDRLRTLAFACKDKSCAPPPVGTGGSAPGTSSSAGNADDVWKESFLKRSASSWTPEGIAVRQYTGGDFGRVNLYLRSGRPSHVYGHPTSELDKFVEEMDSAFDKFGVTLNEPITVHRGAVFMRSADEVSSMFMEGSIVEDKAFVSTSLDKKVGDRFALRNKLEHPDDANDTPLVGNSGVAFKVTLPKGSRVLAGTQYESEFLLPRNSKFRVVSVRKTTKRFVEVTMELVQ